ncbi:hypothetical protein L1987_46327 [Smallanthus sonchifolius]|uniref:Uncharacterized protein n=1 Tax=Smallanthus sonchifolius TaxID=185202 RepID=A0ACB9G000_9ASTR|nr:hypothetical protein L1987_46327 [Smallanthus sonchifolius]
MVGPRGRGRGRGRCRPPINKRQIEEHSYQDTEIHENDDHVSHAETEHEDHVSRVESIHEERFHLKLEVRTTIAEAIGLVLQATLPKALSKALKESNDELKQLLKKDLLDI